MKKIILDSSKSTNRNLNSPSWTLREPISCNKIRYNSIILPLSFDIVNNYNNKIIFGTNIDRKTVSLPSGVYSPDDLVGELTTAMNAVSTQVYTGVYDNLSGRISDTMSSQNVTFQQPIDLTGVKLVLVTSSNLRSSDVIVAGEEGLNIIAAIPVNQETQTILCSQNYFDTDFIDTDTGLVSTIDIQLLDSETLRPLDLNGKGFTIVLDCSSSGFTDDVRT
jgi:hypothetical protein